ncbi:anaerobic ribonucleoside-triphosphate reductase activating protein [Methanocaldococcus villosus KIN24-T80]|uniref:Anaerobic ribonucleoside-triphosphate reductase activating protein n=1 Tax=Methanocaldococcus villosus KIN24-T80 TaxID=1069083 RepID=N6UU98_9EURY|nr:anaerobic ribonucleoside-triphosphate reductase activating protein [Methanocaldococcus villosus]ENN95924.1 anaerobic ribonucleoside-triphosphate reductase activating protein [Methanocaldococcus villosus KIN24-T80]
MRVAGIVDLSTIDYPKKCASVIFLSGCNMRCPYCHNLKYVLENGKEMSIEEIFDNIDFLFADAVVISGGEPTLQRDVVDLAKFFKERGFSVKLDTNGSNPNVVREMLDYIDYIAIDVKCSFSRYKEFVKYDGNIKEKILEIIKMCKNKVFVECRTTFVPKYLNEKDIEEIAKTVKDCDLYAIQQFDPKDAYDTSLKKISPPNEKELINLGKLARKYIKNVIVRTFDREILID